MSLHSDHWIEDEDSFRATLQAIKDGTCQGTVVQNPYAYGVQPPLQACAPCALSVAPIISRWTLGIPAPP